MISLGLPLLTVASWQPDRLPAHGRRGEQGANKPQLLVMIVLTQARKTAMHEGDAGFIEHIRDRLA